MIVIFLLSGSDKILETFQTGQQFQTQFAQPSQFVPQQTQFIPQQQQPQGGGFGLGDIASTLMSVLGKKRRKRQTTMHGQAIRWNYYAHIAGPDLINEKC